MEFFKHQPLWTLLKQVNCRDMFSSKASFFKSYQQAAEANEDAFAFRRGIMEDAWERLERPYYNLYPAILPMLMSIKLDIPCSTLRHISIEPIEIRLPKDLQIPGLCWPEARVKSLLMGLQLVPSAVDADELITGMCLCFDIGEVDEIGHPVLAFKFFPLRDDLTIEEAMNLFPSHESLGAGIPIPAETMAAVVRLCACVALIDSDSDIISPDILADDKAKWDGATEVERTRMAEKAKRRGKFGWNVGSAIEHAPHYRRPHPALVRVGKGRKLTRIVMRKGAVVHRNKLTSIPSGFSVNCYED